MTFGFAHVYVISGCCSFFKYSVGPEWIVKNVLHNLMQKRRHLFFPPKEKRRMQRVIATKHCMLCNWPTCCGLFSVLFLQQHYLQFLVCYGSVNFQHSQKYQTSFCGIYLEFAVLKYIYQINLFSFLVWIFHWNVSLRWFIYNASHWQLSATLRSFIWIVLLLQTFS